MAWEQTNIHHVAVNPHLSLAYQRIAGDEGLPTLLFLHEGLGCIAMWKDFPEQLCARLGCPGVVYDRQGYGQSTPLTAPRTVHYLHRYALDELPAVIGLLLPRRPFIIIGHSDGGSIGLIHGAERNPLLKGVITEAAHVCVDAETLQGIHSTVSAYQAGRLSGLSKYHGTKTDAVFQAWARTWLADWYQAWSLIYLLPSINCPVLAIQGEDDTYGHSSQVTKIVNGVAGPATPAMIARCGHVPHHEQRERVLTVMAEFICAQIV